MIVTGDVFFSDHPVTPSRSFEDYVRRYLLRGAQRRGVRLLLEPAEVEPLKAWVSEGRWIVRCGGVSCHGAERVWEGGLVMCASCWNSYAGHKLVRTSFPRSRKRIETLLDVRPLESRNWLLGETVADLEAQNAEHEAELVPAVEV